MSEIPKRTQARAEFALGILARHRRNLDAAIDALHAVEETQRYAAIATESVAQITAEEKQRLAAEIAAAEADILARLAPDDATTDSLAGAPVPASDRSRSTTHAVESVALTEDVSDG